MPRLSGSRPGRRVVGAMPNPFGQMSLRTTGGSGNPYGGHGGTGFNPANSGCVKDGPRRATDTVPFRAAFVPFSRDPTGGRDRTSVARMDPDPEPRRVSTGSALADPVPDPPSSVPPRNERSIPPMLLSGFGQVVNPGYHGLAVSDAFADMQGVGAPMSDHERLAALVGNPLAPHQPPRADPGADASTYYSGCVRNLSPPNAREYSSVTSTTKRRAKRRA